MSTEPRVQGQDELDAFYERADPWGYDSDPCDQLRLRQLLALVGGLRPRRTLEIGCGNGFLTLHLPGETVTGIDFSANAIEHARRRASVAENAAKFDFRTVSLFDAQDAQLGRFDLVVIAGVLYRQYIGRAVSVARVIIDELVQPGGYIASCHIVQWEPPRLAHTLIDESVYDYREYTHLLEVVRT